MIPLARSFRLYEPSEDIKLEQLSFKSIVKEEFPIFDRLLLSSWTASCVILWRFDILLGVALGVLLDTLDDDDDDSAVVVV